MFNGLCYVPDIMCTYYMYYIMCTSCPLCALDKPQISTLPSGSLLDINVTEPHAQKHLRADWMYKKYISAHTNTEQGGRGELFINYEGLMTSCRFLNTDLHFSLFPAREFKFLKKRE